MTMLLKSRIRRIFWTPTWLFVFSMSAPLAWAAEHVTLRNGFEFICVRQEPQGDQVRLFFASTQKADENYVDVPADSVVSVEVIPEALHIPAQVPSTIGSSNAKNLHLTRAELKEMIARAGAQHHIDADLLASVIQAESNGYLRAVSRTGARGLMQLMPSTASALGVKDAFLADQNVEGGTKYLDQLLTQYHGNILLALAAYNAGPGAVDRYHGVPPFHETRAYVARVIREFNRRKAPLMARSE